MNLVATHVGDVVVVGASGELDTFAVTAFREEVGARAHGRPAVVVDLAGVTFIDSAGLHVLFGIGSAVRRAGGWVLYVVPPEAVVRSVIDLVRLADVCPVCESVDQALARIPEAGPGAFGPSADRVDDGDTESSAQA